METHTEAIEQTAAGKKVIRALRVQPPSLMHAGVRLCILFPAEFLSVRGGVSVNRKPVSEVSFKEFCLLKVF